MARLVWDATGERFYEMGVSNGVLFTPKTTGGTVDPYGTASAWNGLINVSESPEGGDANDLYADDIKYASIRAAEKLNGSIEAYTYPDEFAVCDGSAEVLDGVMIGQQSRAKFGFSYVTKIGNDVNSEVGYKIHLIYGCSASPSERSYDTINDSPDAITFSWDFDTTPVSVGEGYKPTASIVIDSTKVDSTKLEAFKDTLYGTANSEPHFPLPDEVIDAFD